MPTRHSVKEYKENGIYHVYNRGVAKGNIFLDKQDYKTFLYFLKLYLSDYKELKKGLNPREVYALLAKQNFHERIDLLAYCLMPNHFHLEVKQKDPEALTEFMRCLATNYSMYFNKRHDRVGSLFQGIYKAILIKDEGYFLHLSRYIHLNPLELKGFNPQNLEGYDYSSYQDYLDQRNTKWVKPDLILGSFGTEQKGLMKNRSSYKSFVEDHAIDSKEYLGRLSIDQNT